MRLRAWARSASLARAWRWLQATAIAEGERWTLWLPVALGIGIGVYFSLPSEPSPALALPFLASGLSVAIVAATSETMLSGVSLRFLTALLIGFSVAELRTAHAAAPVLLDRVGPIPIEGRVESAGPHGKSMRVELALSSIGRMRPHTMPVKICVSIRSDVEDLKPGDTISLRAVLMPPPAPDDYDFGRATYCLRIGAVSYAYGKPTMIAAGHVDCP